MDLLALGKRAILIPTPGQTEQQYLGSLLSAQDGFHAVKQQGFNLSKALSAFSGKSETHALQPASYQLFKTVLTKWTEGL